MSVFSPIPLGQRIPGSPHSVACSLPTLHDIVGYEEGRPETTRHIASGYPRFVVHSHAKQLCEYLGGRPGLAGRSLWLVTSARMAAALADHLGRTGPAQAAPFSVDGIDGVAHTDTPELNARGKVFLQHLGGGITGEKSLRGGGRQHTEAHEMILGGAGGKEATDVLQEQFAARVQLRGVGVCHAVDALE